MHAFKCRKSSSSSQNNPKIYETKATKSQKYLFIISQRTMKLLNKRLFYKSGRNGYNLKEKMKMTVSEKEQKQNTKVAPEQNVDCNDGDELEGSTPMKLLSKIDDLAPSLVSLTNECFLLKEQESSLSNDDMSTSLSSQCDKSKNKRMARKAVCILCIVTIVGDESHVVSLVKEHRILIPLLNALDNHWWAINCDGCHFDDGKDSSNNGNNEEEEEKEDEDDYSINGSSESKALPWSRRPDLRRRLEKEQKILCLIFEAIERIFEVFFHPNNGCYLVDHSEVVRELLSYTMLDSSSSSSSSSSTSSFAKLRGCDTYSRHKMKEMEGRANKVLQSIFNLGQNNNKSNLS